MRSLALASALGLGTVAACAEAKAPGTTRPTDIVVAPPTSSADAGDPRDAVCTALQAESAAARARAEEEMRTMLADPQRISGARAEAEKHLADDRSELARWTRVLEREKALPKPDPNWVSMATLGIESSTRRIKDAAAALLAPPARPLLPEDLPKPNLPPYLNKCSKVSDGVWATVLEELHLVEVRESEIETFVRGRWVVVHVGLDGKRVEIMPRAAMNDAPSVPDGGVVPALGNIPLNVLESMIAPDPVAFDFDGDGHSEYIVSIGFTILSMNSDEVDVWGHVLTLKNGEIRMYKPAKNLSITAVRDVNGDGRPDLLTSSQHHEDAPDDCDHECGGDFVDDPDQLWLSRVDGTFTETAWPEAADAGEK